MKKNNIIAFKNTAKIILKNGAGAVTGQAIIDIEDIEKVENQKWFLTNSGYVIAHIKEYNKRMLLHRYVLGEENIKEGQVVDHINTNKLDCRKENLRVVDRSTNCHNVSNIGIRNKSGKRGVSFLSGRKTYKASIMKNGKHIWLGNYKDFTDAVEARQKAEIKYLGELLHV